MICEICGIRLAVHKHHKLSQTKLYRKTYKDFIDHRDNLVIICEQCHLWDNPPKWSEYEFCKNFNIKPRTTSGIEEWERREK
jgi:hypothetical protein